MRTYIELETTDGLCLSGQMMSNDTRFVSFKITEPSKELILALFERKITFSLIEGCDGTNRAIITLEQERIKSYELLQK